MTEKTRRARKAANKAKAQKAGLKKHARRVPGDAAGLSASFAPSGELQLKFYPPQGTGPKATELMGLMGYLVGQIQELLKEPAGEAAAVEERLGVEIKGRADGSNPSP